MRNLTKQPTFKPGDLVRSVDTFLDAPTIHGPFDDGGSGVGSAEYYRSFIKILVKKDDVGMIVDSGVWYDGYYHYKVLFEGTVVCFLEFNLIRAIF